MGHCFLATVCVIAALSNEGWADNNIGIEILRALDVPVMGCSPEVKDLYMDHISVRCGPSTHTPKSIKRILRRAARPGGQFHGKMDGHEESWHTTGPLERTLFDTFKSVPIAIVLDEEANAIRIHWPERYPECHSGLVVPWLRSTNVNPPIQTGFGSDSGSGPINPRDDGGAVIGSYVIDTEGRVIDVCIVAVRPAGDEASRIAVETFATSRFKPATRDGQPVSVAEHFALSRSPRGVRVLMGALVREYFGKQRLVESEPTESVD